MRKKLWNKRGSLLAQFWGCGKFLLGVRNLVYNSKVQYKNDRFAEKFLSLKTCACVMTTTLLLMVDDDDDDDAADAHDDDERALMSLPAAAMNIHGCSCSIRRL